MLIGPIARLAYKTRMAKVPAKPDSPPQTRVVLVAWVAQFPPNKKKAPTAVTSPAISENQVIRIDPR
jgi:hypothetical protein